jgi:hypothetical protein
VLRPLGARVVPVRIARGKYTTEITWTKLGDRLRELLGAMQGQRR